MCVCVCVCIYMYVYLDCLILLFNQVDTYVYYSDLG